MKNQEFEIPDYTEEIGNVKKLVESCRKQLVGNKIQGIPYFNEILNRELDAVVEALTKIDHFHASARSARAALELSAVNLYRHFYPGGRPLDMSFWEKYGLKKLTHRSESPLLELVREGIWDDAQFGLFCESYGNLSEYVHHRVTYHLAHTVPKHVPEVQWYAKTLSLAGKKGRVATIVKATLVKYSLVPALDTLLMILRSYESIPRVNATAVRHKSSRLQSRLS